MCSLKLVLYLDITAISKQIKYYLTTNRGNFLEMQYGFYRYGHYLLLKEHLTKAQEKLQLNCLEHHYQR